MNGNHTTVAPLITDNTPSPAEMARIESEYLEAPKTVSVVALHGRVRRILGAADLAGLGDRPLEAVQEQTAKAAALAYDLLPAIRDTQQTPALTARQRGELVAALARSAWLLERVNYCDTKTAAQAARKAAMWELGAVQLVSERITHNYLKAKGQAA